MQINPNTQADLNELNATLARMEWKRDDENDRLALIALDEDGDEFEFDAITIEADEDPEPYETAEIRMVDRHSLPTGFPLETNF